MLKRAAVPAACSGVWGGECAGEFWDFLRRGLPEPAEKMGKILQENGEKPLFSLVYAPPLW